MMGFKTENHVKSTTVAKLILDKLKNMIIEKVLKPGERLPSESELAETFGVGKSTIREVVKMLDAVGIIESKPGHGTFICDSPKEDKLNPLIFQLLLLNGSDEAIIEFRRMYETAYTFLAMENMGEEDKEIISSMIETPRSAREDADFHRAVLRSTHNPYVIRTGEILIDLYEITLNRTANPASGYDSSEDHRKIFMALCDKDREALRRILRESFEEYAKALLKKDRYPSAEADEI